ncbi:phage terminase large subunit [Magnetospirillum sulfuroxidans]|uniref:Phage terminase large subunit n=1 Tax=Magnetospirillum sulfuroxidans TaxID=611300 RepID=A0ABS5IAA9_9PROT|nr:phage terminase large subunit [Magnetospirillum sulfuroxidans]MBR9971221.1 phage terminase large subunit [Magnetospirillum sulfuroxidans]
MSKIGFPEFVWVWNAKLGQTTPPHHLRLARWLARKYKSHHRELLLMAFRSSGKSTIVGLFCAWALLGDPNLRIIILAADFALAKKMVRNVKRIIERHPLTQGLKPKRRDHWASDQFTVNRPGELRDPSMVAKGIGANITGSRAEIVICDDVEVPNTCDSAPKRADLRERLGEIEYVLVPGGMQLYVGTPHSFYTIYADKPRLEAGEERPFLDGFHRLELPLIDQDGASAWPDRFPPEKIAAMRKRSGPNKFDSQMLLKPVNIADGRLDPDRLRLYETELNYAEGNSLPILTLGDKRLVSAACWWDPAYGAPGKGDASVVAAMFTDQDGGYWLHRVQYLTHDPARRDEDEATQLCRQVAAFAQDLHLPAVSLETNGLGRFLPGLLRRELAKAGYPCAVVEVASRKAKDQRIIDAFDAVLAAGALSAHRSVWTSPFVSEMREWQPGGKSRDDGLDAVAGCLLSQPVRLTRPTVKAGERADWRPGNGGVRAPTDFDL